MSPILGIEQHRCVEIKEQTLSLPVGLLLGRHWGVCIERNTVEYRILVGIPIHNMSILSLVAAPCEIHGAQE